MITWWRITNLLALGSFVASPGICDWELRRDDLSPARPVITDGVVQTDTAGKEELFPRYLNELGVKVIKLVFHDEEPGRRTLSVVWTGGSLGPDRFEVVLDGVSIGRSQLVNSSNRPYAWYRDNFTLNLMSGKQHVLEIRSLPETSSALEFTGMRWSREGASHYQPLCYESIGTLARYEMELGTNGVMVDSPHLLVFAPADKAAEARKLSIFLEKAYAGLCDLYGMDPTFRFSVEHYPTGHKRAWGGISGAGTIGYSVEALDRFAKLGTSDVRGFAGYTEEMSHGFKAHYKATGTYEALGVAIQEDLVRRLVSQSVADAFWLPEHEQWDRTHKAYLAAGRSNPEPSRYPNNVLYTRILNNVFSLLRMEYGPGLWPDFFAAIRKRDYPLHVAKESERMGIYADVFSELLNRDVRSQFERWGIDLKANPPWGWQTYE